MDGKGLCGTSTDFTTRDPTESVRSWVSDGKEKREVPQRLLENEQETDLLWVTANSKTFLVLQKTPDGADVTKRTSVKNPRSSDKGVRGSRYLAPVVSTPRSRQYGSGLWTEGSRPCPKAFCDRRRA